ncbi:MAG: RNA polymerase sigma factor [Acidobacteria bacterium]|nr:RNA polymerase sigma factor [Acidobacteriota bacterium]
MTDADDEILARRAAEGDRNAFSELLERHYGLIYRVGARMLGNGAEAEDLAQDVCLGLVTRLASYGGKSRFTTWLYRVVVNAARDSMRRDSTRRRHEQEFVEQDGLGHRRSVTGSEDSVWLQQVLGQLSEELRATVILVLAEGLKHGEAGNILGVSEATVSWRLHQVRKQLRSQKTQSKRMVL